MVTQTLQYVESTLGLPSNVSFAGTGASSSIIVRHVVCPRARRHICIYGVCGSTGRNRSS